MKCLRVFGRNVSASAARKIKSNVSRARHHQHRAGATRTTLARGAHNQRRRRPRNAAGSRDHQLIAARTDRLWNFGVESGGAEQPGLMNGGSGVGANAARGSSLHRQQPVQARTYHSTSTTAGTFGGRMEAIRNGFHFGGGSTAVPMTSSPLSQMGDIVRYDHQFAYGTNEPQHHYHHGGVNLKALKRQYGLVCLAQQHVW